MNGSRAFTLAEATLSTAIFGVLLAGVTAITGGAMGSMKASSDASEEVAKTTRSENSIHSVLLSASLSSLTAIPPGGRLAEPLQEDVVYNNLSFRRVVGIEGDKADVEPDVDLPPYSLFLETAEDGTLQVVLDMDENRVVVASVVSGLTIVRNRSTLAIDISYSGTDSSYNDSSRSQPTRLEMVLRTP